MLLKPILNIAIIINDQDKIHWMYINEEVSNVTEILPRSIIIVLIKYLLLWFHLLQTRSTSFSTKSFNTKVLNLGPLDRDLGGVNWFDITDLRRFNRRRIKLIKIQGRSYIQQLTDRRTYKNFWSSRPKVVWVDDLTFSYSLVLTPLSSLEYRSFEVSLLVKYPR